MGCGHDGGHVDRPVGSSAEAMEGTRFSSGVQCSSASGKEIYLPRIAPHLSSAIYASPPPPASPRATYPIQQRQGHIAMGPWSLYLGTYVRDRPSYADVPSVTLCPEPLSRPGPSTLCLSLMKLNGVGWYGGWRWGKDFLYVAFHRQVQRNM